MYICQQRNAKVNIIYKHIIKWLNNKHLDYLLRIFTTLKLHILLNVFTSQIFVITSMLKFLRWIKFFKIEGYNSNYNLN